MTYQQGLGIIGILLYSNITISSKLNRVGLTLDFVGVFFILLYGIPTKCIDTRYKRNTEGSLFEEVNVTKQIYNIFRDKYNKIIKFNYVIGFVYLLIGFGMQIISNFIQY